jgi:DNA-binding NarL/FixJ family response regulator
MSLRAFRRRSRDRGGMSRSSQSTDEKPTNVSAVAHPPAESVTVVLGLLDAVLMLGVATLLRGDGRLSVTECGAVDTVLEDALTRWEPKVIILGEKADPATVERLRTVRQRTRILVLAHDPTHDDGMGLLAAGANCVSRNAEEVDVLDAVYRTVRGERFFISADGELIERRYPTDAVPLTDREREVLVYLARGKPYPVVARRLNISPRTVHTHTAAILRKLRMKEKQDLIGLPIHIRPGGD